VPRQRRSSSLVKTFALLAFLTAFTRAASATTIVLAPDEELVVGARAIMRGRVVSMTSQQDQASGRIFTYVTVKVQDVLKGEINSGEIVLKEEGGQVGTIVSALAGAPRFVAGERVILYLDTWGDGSLRVHDLFLGKFSIVEDPRTGTTIARRDAPDAQTVFVDGRSLGRLPRRTTSVMELDRYVAMIRGLVRENRQRSQAFERLYYANTPLLMRPPESPVVNPGEIQPGFVLFPSGTPARWFEPDEGQPVLYHVNPNQMPSATTPDDMSAAMNTWSVLPGCSLRMSNAGLSDACNQVGQNAITFDNCDGRFAPTSGCASVLAITWLVWDSSQRKTVNGQIFNRITDGHISFNPYASCDFGDPCKVREIATHELGHTVGLNHSEFSDATMFAFIHYDGRCASVRPDDINGAVFVYPGSAAGPPSITQDSLPSGTVNISYSQTLAATGGVAPYTWNVDQGSLPTGLSLTLGGLLSGTPSAAGTFNFTLKVTDSIHATAVKSLSITVNGAASPYDSQFVSQSVPSALQPGQTFFATLRWMNTGVQAWDPASGFKIASQNPPNNRTWGGDTVGGVTSRTDAGGQLTLVFQATAPASNGIYNFQWQPWQPGVNFFGQMSANVQITVTDGSSPTITAAASLDAFQGVAFSYQIPVRGGVPPYSWSMTGGALPAGLTFSSSGMITGTPTAEATASIQVQVTDATGNTAQKTIAVNVAPPSPQIATTIVPNGQTGLAYSFGLSAVSGKAPYRWTLVAGGLPPGLTLSPVGAITGTPSAEGVFEFTVEVADSDNRTSRKTLAISILPPPLVVTHPPAQDIPRGASYIYQLAASGGRAPYSWTLDSGELPPGIALNANGLLSGKPTQDGTYALIMSVHDASGTALSLNLQIRVLDPDSIPAVKKIKYKKGKDKLIVNGRNVADTAVLKVDGVLVDAIPVAGQFSIKRLNLQPGRHEIIIVNPNSISSQPVSFTIE